MMLEQRQISWPPTTNLRIAYDLSFQRKRFNVHLLIFKIAAMLIHCIVNATGEQRRDQIGNGSHPPYVARTGRHSHICAFGLNRLPSLKTSYSFPLERALSHWQIDVVIVFDPAACPTITS